MGRAKQPKSITKDIRELQCLVQRNKYLHLDSAPFMGLYVILLASAAKESSTGSRVGPIPMKYVLGAVLLLHILSKLFTHWFVNLKSRAQYIIVPVDKASHIKVTPAEFTGHTEIVRVDHHDPEPDSVLPSISFEFRKQRYCYSQTDNTFDRLRYPDKEPLTHYYKANGHTTEAKVKAAEENWGANKFVVPLPEFLAMLKEQLLAPFFVFQVFCVGLWCLDEYWYYSMFTLVMLIVFESTLVFQRIRQLKEIRNLQTPPQSLQVYRFGKWDKVAGEALLPGDVISITRPTGTGAEEKVVPADLLLLAGTCIVEEAVLTGESTPQWKLPITKPADKPSNGKKTSTLSPEEILNITRDKQHVLFSGTKVLQHTADKNAHLKTPDGGCLAVVLRTGFGTSQGQLMRTILYSTERVTSNNWETGIFIMFLMVFAIMASAYVLYYGLQDPDRNKFKLVLNCTMIITSVIPPELPMELSIAINTSLLNLARKFVFCTEPFRIPIAGKVSICCFDKTGTLTSDNMMLEGLCGLPGTSGELQRDIKQAPREAIRVLAGCQALIQVDGELVGDPLERTSFQAIEWVHTAGNISSPKRDGEQKETVAILQRFHFSSMLKRMSTIVRVETDGSSNSQLWVLAKGAPEVIQQYLGQTPDGYENTYREFAAQGGRSKMLCRVIALAYKKLAADQTAAQIRELSRDEVEKDLEFGGFAILQCPLKPESEPALRMLKESSHQLVMITGDAPLTACHAASKVHIVDRPTIILTGRDEEKSNKLIHTEQALADSHFHWISQDGQTDLPFSRDAAAALDLATQYDLCITGTGLTHLHNVNADAAYIPLTQVFARVSPDQKELILRVLRAAGWVTLMCGDGTNDVGALKTAHVGVALLQPKPKKKEAKANGEKADKKPKPKPEVIGPGAKMLEEMRKKGRPVTPWMEKMAANMDKMQKEGADLGEAPMVKPGDASMASPFTAKIDNVLPCTDIIKQGRSTLVNTVQMFKILGLLCLSTAYSLSVMYLQGVKVGDLQATAQGFLSAYLFFVISNGKPQEKLSKERPHPSIFCAYVFLSVLGQFVLHMSFLIYMYYAALRTMPADFVQKPDTDFEPNLVNTVCFLVQWVVQLTTFAVNYMGHPFNTSLEENGGMAIALRWGAIGFVLACLNIIPYTDWALSLVPLPRRLCVSILALAFLDYSLSRGWEFFLRQRFPAPCPPQKGYLHYRKQQIQDVADKKKL